MAVCIIVTLSPKDPEKMAEYSAQAAETLKSFQGEIIARGPVSALSGASAPAAAIMRFPTEALAQSWYQSDAYQALVPLRQQAMDADFLLIPAE